MRLTRQLLNKQVRVTWKDPKEARVGSRYEDHHDIPRGRASLATWVEWGLVEDITDGVLHLRQGRAIDPPLDQDRTYTVVLSVIPEELIEKVVMLVDGEEVA